MKPAALVEQLRRAAQWFEVNNSEKELFIAAAAEIERLKAALDAVCATARHCQGCDAFETAWDANHPLDGREKSA